MRVEQVSGQPAGLGAARGEAMRHAASRELPAQLGAELATGAEQQHGPLLEDAQGKSSAP